MGSIESCKKDAYHVRKYSRLTGSRYFLFIFLKYIFDLLVTVRVSQGFLSLFAFPKIFSK